MKAQLEHISISWAIQAYLLPNIYRNYDLSKEQKITDIQNNIMNSLHHFPSLKYHDFLRSIKLQFQVSMQIQLCYQHMLVKSQMLICFHSQLQTSINSTQTPILVKIWLHGSVIPFHSTKYCLVLMWNP